MFPVTLIPAVIVGLIVAAVGFYMKFSEERDERRDGRKP